MSTKKTPWYETSPNEPEEEGKREYPLGFITDVPPGEVVAITNSPQTRVRMGRLFVPRELGVHFKICGLYARGDTVLLPVDDEIAAAIFAERERARPLPENVVAAGEPVTLRVRNMSSEKRRFMAAIFCTLLR
jgi:hypothetical protein